MATIIGIILMGSFVAGGIRDRKTGNRIWEHPGSAAIRVICVFALLVNVIIANFFG